MYVETCFPNEPMLDVTHAAQSLCILAVYVAGLAMVIYVLSYSMRLIYAQSTSFSLKWKVIYRTHVVQ